MLLFTFFLPSLLFFVLLIIYCHLIGVRWHLTVVLIVFPLWLVISYIFSCSCWPSVCHLWKNIYADTLPFFNDLHFFFSYSVFYFFISLMVTFAFQNILIWYRFVCSFFFLLPLPLESDPKNVAKIKVKEISVFFVLFCFVFLGDLLLPILLSFFKNSFWVNFYVWCKTEVYSSAVTLKFLSYHLLKRLSFSQCVS